MKNIFADVKNLVELEQAYEKALKTLELDEKIIEKMYLERRKQLLTTAISVTPISKFSTSSEHKKHKRINKKESGYYIKTPAKEFFPAYEIDLPVNSEPLSFFNIKEIELDEVKEIKDYYPRVENNKLILKLVTRNSQIEEISRNIAFIEEELGENVNVKPYFTKNELVKEKKYTIITTYLISPKTGYTLWKIRSVAGIVNGKVMLFKLYQL